MTPAPLSKFHHYVARTHLARFATPAERLWVYDKRPGKLFDRAIDEAFGETHLNTIDQPDGTRDQTLESELAVLESRAYPVIEEIVAAARAGLSTDVGKTKRDIWDRYYMAQFSRTPDNFNATPTLQMAHELIHTLAMHYKEKYPERAEEADAAITDSERKRLIKAARIQAQRKEPERLTALLASRSLAALQPVDPSRKFVIGSNPFVRWGDDLRKPETRLWLPVAPDLAVGPGIPGTGATLYLPEDPAEIDRFNLTLATRSTVFASADRVLIETLIDQLKP